MKKKNIFKVIIASAAIMFSLSSCSKCQTCSYGGDSEEFCQDDFSDKDEYKGYIALIEAFGGTCK